jgi:hypothetical protein
MSWNAGTGGAVPGSTARKRSGGKDKGAGRRRAAAERETGQLVMRDA